MSRTTKVLVGAGVALAIVLISAGVAWSLSPKSLQAEYPDAPFPRLEAAAPRIIYLDDPPPQEKKPEYDAFWAARIKLNQYLRDEGAMADATPDEREAYRLVMAEEYAEARDLVVKILGTNPQSVPARFALVIIEQKSEENFARALLLIRKLRHEMHNRGVANPQDAVAREWYMRVLDREYWLLETLDYDEEELRLVDLIEQVYQPMQWRRLVPLLHLSRYDECQAVLNELGPTPVMRDRVDNAKMALATKLGQREVAYEMGKMATDATPTSALVWYNFSGKCNNSFRFEEAEEALLKSSRIADVDFFGSPFILLASLLAEKGQPREAWDALKKAQSQRLARDPYTWVMDRNEFDNAVAAILLNLGYGEQAYRLALEAYERPGRHSTYSSKLDVAFGERFTMWQVTDARLKELREIEAAGGPLASYAANEQRVLATRRWTLEKQILMLLDDSDHLVKMLRPRMPGVTGPDTASVPDFLGILPPAVGQEAFRRARAEEPHPAAVAYFDATAVNRAWRAGRLEEAITLAQATRVALPERERSLRATMSLIEADCLRQLNRVDEARPLYDHVLTVCPALLRYLDVPLPVLIAEDGSPLASSWANVLLASPRFQGHELGMPLLLRTAGDQLTFELMRDNNTRHCQGSVLTAPAQDIVLADATARLIGRMMSPVLDLTSADINAMGQARFSTPASKETDRLLKMTVPK